MATVYAIAFFSCRLSSVADPNTGAPLSRSVFWFEALLPERMIFGWFGPDLPLGLVDRLPLVAVAATVWLAAWGAGRVMLTALGLDRGLTTPERLFLAAAAGANLFSLYVLVCGLAGSLSRLVLFGPPVLAALWARSWRSPRSVVGQPKVPMVTTGPESPRATLTALAAAGAQRGSSRC